MARMAGTATRNKSGRKSGGKRMTTVEVADRQQRFIRHYVKYGDKRAAAEALGVSKNTINNWLKDKKIQEQIELVQRNALLKVGYDKEKWLKDTLELLDRAMGRKPKDIVPEGGEPEYRVNYTEARKTLEMLGKFLGVCQDTKVDIKHIGKIEISWKAPSVERAEVLEIGDVIRCGTEKTKDAAI